MKIDCVLEFDERTSTVTLRHAKTQATVMMIKLEAGMSGTMKRVPTDGSVDCDNFWIGLKPSDSMVFDDLLYGDSVLSVENVKFNLSGGRDRKRHGLD